MDIYAERARNRLLAAIPDDAYHSISKHLVPKAFSRLDRLSDPETESQVVFPLSGLISVNVGDAPERCVEVSLIGNDGCAGLWRRFGARRHSLRKLVVLPGDSLRIDGKRLATVAADHSDLMALLLLYSQVLRLQCAYSAYANLRATVEQRVARWLLMAQDRVGEVLHLTHLELANLLGVRRASVTVSLHQFAQNGSLSLDREEITIVRREALVKVAGEFYGEPEAEFLWSIEGETN